jgi:antitoxin (DNA-binding transcriptional repressor) of toxin-antitoxin stability system
MKTVNIHQAKAQLSRLIDDASKGKAFIITEAGKAMVKVALLDAPAFSRIVPDEFDRMDVEGIFSGKA